MKEPKVLLTMKDIKRHEIIKEVLAKRLNGIQASEVLGRGIIESCGIADVKTFYLTKLLCMYIM